MFRKMLIACFLMLTLTSLSHAQLGEPVTRLYPTPESAEVILDDDGKLVLVVSGSLPDGCDLETVIETERGGAAWFVDMYRELPEELVCPAMLQSFEERIDASALLDMDENATLPMVIIINGKIYGVNHAQIGGMGQAPAPMLDEYWVRNDIALQSITFIQHADGSADLAFNVQFTDSCPQLAYRAYGVWDREGLMMLEAYTVLPINAMCQRVTRDEAYLVEGLMFYNLSINGVIVPHNTVTTEAGDYTYLIQPMGGESATAEWVTLENGQRAVHLTVKGYTDGCDFPIQVVPGHPVDNAYIVQVVRTIPNDMMCTMIAREFTAEHTFVPVTTTDAPLTFIIGEQKVSLPLE